MSDKTRRRIEILSMDDTIKDYSGKEYPVDILKETYIKSGKSVKRLAREYGLPVKVVEKYVRAGKWDALQQKYHQQWVNNIANSLKNNLQTYVNVAERLETLKLMEIQQQLDHIEEHFNRFGDFFQRDEFGEIIHDKNGNPIKLKFPSKYESEYLMNWAKIRELSSKVLIDMGILKPLSNEELKLEGEILGDDEMKDIFGE